MKAIKLDFNRFLYNLLLRMSKKVLRETKPKTPVDTGDRPLGIITASGLDIAVEIINPTEYATDIEYGHRIGSAAGENKMESFGINEVFMLKTSIDKVVSKMSAV